MSLNEPQHEMTVHEMVIQYQSVQKKLIQKVTIRLTSYTLYCCVGIQIKAKKKILTNCSNQYSTLTNSPKEHSIVGKFCTVQRSS